ncbi:MAG: shikimate dehydrogenase [Alphaproteobacteria bacterium]|nr:shikimate dehydrogenase [Alphaproteobacteria bacterium]
MNATASGNTTVTGKTALLGLLGWPVKHSLSPRLHNYWLAQCGIDAVYLPLPVAPEALAAVLPALPKMGFVGVNVTIPHKEALCGLVGTLDPVAARISAVNTVAFPANRTSIGSNTDAFGFAESVRQAGHNLAAGPALVLGAGGAARAVLAALQASGCPEILLANRTPERALTLAQQFPGVKVTPWEKWHEPLAQTSLLINTTSRGLNGQDDFIVDLTTMPGNAAVCDLVYRPLQTGLLRAADAAGLSPIDGLGMLLYQAQASFNTWFGVTPPIDAALRRFVLAGIAV